MSGLQAELSDVVATLFRRYPALCGFSVSKDLSFSDIACHPALGSREVRLLCAEISEALHELLDEKPEAAELLRGRTLARTFH